MNSPSSRLWPRARREPVMLNEVKGNADMARGEPVVKADKESRPSPIDVHVGSRIRLRRTLAGHVAGTPGRSTRPDLPAGAEI